MDKSQKIRYCCACNKLFNLKEVKKRYPHTSHEILIRYWQNPETKFYCKFCYLLKIIGLARKNAIHQKLQLECEGGGD